MRLYEQRREYFAVVQYQPNMEEYTMLSFSVSVASILWGVPCWNVRLTTSSAIERMDMPIN